MKERSEPIIIERLYNVDAEKVWQALTRPEQMRAWFFEEIPDFSPEAGFTTKFTVEVNGRTFTHLWQVIEAEQHRKLSLDWRYTEYEGRGVVLFELFTQSDGTLVRLTNTGLETFPAEIPEFSRDAALGGWSYFMKERLPEYLNSQEPI